MSGITIIGSGIIDVLVEAIEINGFKEINEAKSIKTAFGGDALNEAIDLSRLGKEINFISKVGNDLSGKQVLNFLKNNNIDLEFITIEDNLTTSTNIVIIDSKGERSFITSSNSSLRKLTKDDILPKFKQKDGIVSFASIFVSPLLNISDMEEVFKKVKENNNILITDSTRPKRGETLKDLKPLFKYIDFFLINESEFATLCGSNNLETNIRMALEAGIKKLIVKCGRKGSYYCTSEKTVHIPAYLIKNPIDTTGAGDSFAAGFIYGLSENWSIYDALLFASAVASCIVEEVGANTGLLSKDKPIKRFKRLKEL